LECGDSSPLSVAAACLSKESGDESPLSVAAACLSKESGDESPHSKKPPVKLSTGEKKPGVGIWRTGLASFLTFVLHLVFRTGAAPGNAFLPSRGKVAPRPFVAAVGPQDEEKRMSPACTPSHHCIRSSRSGLKALEQGHGRPGIS
jgi:hypothetical protein